MFKDYKEECLAQTRVSLGRNRFLKVVNTLRKRKPSRMTWLDYFCVELLRDIFNTLKEVVKIASRSTAAHSFFRKIDSVSIF